MCDWEVQRFCIFKGNRKGEHFQEKDMEAKIIVWWNEPFYSFSNFYWRKVGFGIIILGQLREEEGNGSDDFSLVFSFMVILWERKHLEQIEVIRKSHPKISWIIYIYVSIWIKILELTMIWKIY